MSDLISRHDAIEAVTRLCVDGYKAKVDGCFIPLTDALINTLSALPSADQPKGNSSEKEKSIEQFLTLLTINALSDSQGADRQKGEWIDRNNGGDLAAVDFAYCSVCNEPIIHKHTAPLWSFCPNCGADMKGEPETETEPAPVVAYICDRRRCAICSGEDGGCDHTTDIKHAAHFKNVAGQYFESPYMEEEDDE